MVFCKRSRTEWNTRQDWSGFLGVADAFLWFRVEVRGRPFNSGGGGWVISGHQEFFFLAIWWAGYFFPFFSHKLSITFVLHAIFFFRQALAGNFFSKSPTPPPQELNGRPLRTFWRLIKNHSYSFKIFPWFWLAKSTQLIHHNQLLMTKCGRILCDVKNAAFSQVKAPLTEKTWGRGWVVLVVNMKKWRTFHSFQE